MKLNTKFLMIIFCIAIGASKSSIADGQPNFELWNKHDQPLYYSISNSQQEATRKPLSLVSAGKYTSSAIDTGKQTFLAIAVGNQPSHGNMIDVYAINPGKTIYVRVGLPAEKEKFKEIIKKVFGRTAHESKDYIFGPQTGPLLGFKGITEHNYSLSNNVKPQDITKSTLIYTP